MGLFNYFCPKCNNTKISEHRMYDTPMIMCTKCFSIMYRTIKPTQGKSNDRDKETR